MRLPLLAIGLAAAVALAIFATSAPRADPSAPHSTKERRSHLPPTPSHVAPERSLAALPASQFRVRRPPRDPGLAVGSIRKIRGRADRTRAIRLIFSIPSPDAEAMVGLALRLPSRTDRRRAFDALFRAFQKPSRKTNPDLARIATEVNRTLLTQNTHGRRPAASAVLATILSHIGASPTTIVRVAVADSAGSGVNYAAGLLDRVARGNPVLAFSLARLMPDPRQALAAVASGWSRSNPRAAAQWASDIPDGSVRSSAIAGVAATTARLDVRYAASLLDALPPGRERQETLSRVAEAWAYADTDAAFRWAQSLPQSAEAALATDAIRQVAPIGIGVALTTPRDSPYPVAAQVRPGTPAARSGSIRPGDAIVAVAEGSGPWTSTAGQDISSLVGAIRGKSGTSVRVQVMPANGSGEAKVVTLSREQLLFKSSQPGLPNEPRDGGI